MKTLLLVIDSSNPGLYDMDAIEAGGVRTLFSGVKGEEVKEWITAYLNKIIPTEVVEVAAVEELEICPKCPHPLLLHGIAGCLVLVNESPEASPFCPCEEMGTRGSGCIPSYSDWDYKEPECR